MTSVGAIFLIHETQQSSLLKVSSNLSHFGVLRADLLLKLRHSLTVLISSLTLTLLLLPLLTLLLLLGGIKKRHPFTHVNEI